MVQGHDCDDGDDVTILDDNATATTSDSDVSAAAAGAANTNNAMKVTSAADASDDADMKDADADIEHHPQVAEPTREPSISASLPVVMSAAAAAGEDSSCYALIERIRCDKFGVGVAMSDDVTKLFQSHKEIIGRSLDRLSRDLYR